MVSVTSTVRLVGPLALSAALWGQAQLPGQPSLWHDKPDIEAFEKIENQHLQVAQSAIDQLLAVNGQRTIDNTLAPYDEAIRQIDDAQNFSLVMQKVHPDGAFRDRATAITTKAAGKQTDLSLNREVYRALASLDVSSSDAATRYYVQRQLLEFRLAGVDKDDATRTHLKQLQERLEEEKSAFEHNITDDASEIEVSGPAELQGLPQDFVDAQKPGSDGKIRIRVIEPNFLILTFAQNDAFRRRFFEAWERRAYPKNHDVLLAMMKTRYQIATLLGYSSWADFNAADKMVRSGKAIETFIDQVDVAARPVAQREYAMLLAEKQKTHPGATEVSTYEFLWLDEQVRHSRYNFDFQSVRPYFPYDRVKPGVMDTAAKLFGVTFKQEVNAPAWDPSVETWDVIENGKAIGRFYLDMHPRPGKYSHEEMVTLLDGARGKELPEGILICNFPQPTATDPGLMEYDEVVTFFHEFGHLMHHILGGHQAWAGISGLSTNMEDDFVELPSQMLEEWMRDPHVLASFARNYKTGEPIPDSLVEQMNRASTFGRATDVTTQIATAAASYDLYKENPDKIKLDQVALGNIRRYTLLSPISADAYSYAAFSHLANYSSGFYTYLWDKVIAEDFFQQFDQKNLLGGDTPLRYRRQVLEPGGSMSANDLVKGFLGRTPQTEAFGRWLNEEFENPPTKKQP